MTRSGAGRRRTPNPEYASDDAAPRVRPRIIHDGVEVDAMSVAQLQAALTARGLDADGLRASLQHRLIDALAPRTGDKAHAHEQVAAKTGTDGADGAWVLVSVTGYDASKDTYTVQDEDDVLELPASQIRRLGGGDDLQKGERVMAIFPETTVFYRATVAKAPGRRDVALAFEGDDDVYRVALHYVLRETARLPVVAAPPPPPPNDGAPRLSGYLYFSREKRSGVRAALEADAAFMELPVKARNQRIMAKLGELWTDLSPAAQTRWKAEAPPLTKTKKKKNLAPRIAKQTPCAPLTEWGYALAPLGSHGPHHGYLPPQFPPSQVPLPALPPDIVPFLRRPREEKLDEQAERAVFDDLERRYAALWGMKRRMEDELARLKVEEAALRAAAGAVPEDEWAVFDPARDEAGALEAV